MKEIDDAVRQLSWQLVHLSVGGFMGSRAEKKVIFRHTEGRKKSSKRVN